MTDTLTLGPPGPAHLDDSLGRFAYETYAAHFIATTSVKDMPKWDLLMPATRDAWCVAAAAVLQRGAQ